MAKDGVKGPRQQQGVHPSEQELEQFMRGELYGPRLNVVVRHLLRNRCPECGALTAHFWDFAEPQPLDPQTPPPGKPRRSPRRLRRGKAARKALETEAQAMLREAAQDIQEVRERLQGLVKGLPPSPQELDDTDMDPDTDPDITTELRRIVQSVLQDCLDSAIDDLLMAANYRPKVPRRRPRKESAPQLSSALNGGGCRMDLSDDETRFEAVAEDPPLRESRARGN